MSSRHRLLHARDDTFAAHLDRAFAPADRIAHLRVIETTDLHMHLRDYDYLADRRAPGTGLAAAATMIGVLRAEAANTLLLDAGDFLQGTPMGDEAAQAARDIPHPAVAAMSALAYDAVALGNHEFNYGLDVLEWALGAAEFPVVCANVSLGLGADPRLDRTLVAPYALLDRSLLTVSGDWLPIRIGIIGLTPPQITSWDREHLHRRAFVRDMVETARARVPELREAGADLVIALAHTGIGDAEEREGMENAALPLAALDGIDVLAIGHNHKVFPSPEFAARPGLDPVGGRLHGKPAVMAGAYGSHLGVIDLTLSRKGGAWRVIGNRVGAPQVPRAFAGAPSVLAVTEAAHRKTLAGVRKPLGQSDHPLHSYFAMARDMSGLAPIAAAKRRWAEKVLPGTAAEHLPLLIAVAPMRAGGLAGPGHYTDIPAGPLARRHVADLYCFPNTAQILRLTGADLRAWLESAAGAFGTVRPGDCEVPLLNTGFPPYHFDVLYGLTYAFDLSAPPRFAAEASFLPGGHGRVRDIRYAGRPLVDTETFAVVTTSYRAGGGGAIPAVSNAAVLAISDRTIPDLVAEHLRVQSPLMPPPDPVWRFEPIPGATAILETGPGGRIYPGAADRLGLTLIGPNSGGFDRYRLALD